MIKGARRSPYQRRRPSKAFPAVVVLALIAASGLAYFYLSNGSREMPDASPVSEPPQASAPRGEPAESQPLRAQSRALPEPGPGDVRVRVEVCGVCRTDLHVVEGDLDPLRPSIVPGHEIVGHVTEKGSAVTDLKEGDRVGIGWQARSCGKCEWCRKGETQLCMNIEDTTVMVP